MLRTLRQISRRAFLKVTTAATAALAGGLVATELSGCDTGPGCPPDGYGYGVGNRYGYGHGYVYGYGIYGYGCYANPLALAPESNLIVDRIAARFGLTRRWSVEDGSRLRILTRRS
jgi:hypothetical protein